MFGRRLQISQINRWSSLTGKALVSSLVGPMERGAPLFLAPPEAMNALALRGMGNSNPTVSPDAPLSDEFLNMVKMGMPPGGGRFGGTAPLSDEFLDMVKMGMPPGGGRFGGTAPPFTTPEGDVMGLTENRSATYLSSGNACLDFFFKVVPSTGEDTLVWLLERAWKEDALKALKLMFHLRGVRGTGKSDKERFYYAALWLHKHHPATLRENIATVAEFGYFKDLLELLLRLVEDPSEKLKKDIAKARHGEVTKRVGLVFEYGALRKAWQFSSQGCGYYSRKGARARAAKMAGTLKSREERVAASLEHDRALQQKAALVRRERRLAFACQAAEVFSRDLGFQALYLLVAEVFARRLKEDVKALRENQIFDISLAAKWTPSLDSSYDLRTLLCYAIATQMFPKEGHAEYEGMDDRRYGFVVRERLRKEVLVPLRKVLELPEVYMCAQKWGEVNYRRVASVAMTNYKTHFLKHDEERFNKYLEDAKSGKEKLSAGALFPHQIVRSAVFDTHQSAEVAELQWKRLVEDLKKKGLLSNCIAICDVSGSMKGEPMDVCIALGILLADLSQEPWKGHVITFSEQPEIHQIAGESLKQRHKFTRSMDWGMNTNLQLVFDKLLTMAQLNKLAPEKMIKRLFIFSDMEFDEASYTPWETDYKAISRKFKTAGYGTPPDIVFWNLRDSQSIPVLESQTGVALVSGFSKNILKMFLKNDGSIEPMRVLEVAIEGDEYSKLKVVD